MFMHALRNMKKKSFLFPPFVVISINAFRFSKQTSSVDLAGKTHEWWSAENLLLFCRVCEDWISFVEFWDVQMVCVLSLELKCRESLYSNEDGRLGQTISFCQHWRWWYCMGYGEAFCFILYLWCAIDMKKYF